MNNLVSDVAYNKMSGRPQTILTGELVLNSVLETQKASGEFVNNKYLVENICSIVNTLLIHHAQKLTKDHFLGMTIQFSDHYYKIDLSKGDFFYIERYSIIHETENV